MKPDYCSPDGRIQLWCGDCLEIASVIQANAVVMDPPYGIGFASQPTTSGRKRGQGREMWDEVPGEISTLLRLARTLAVWGGNYFSLPVSRGWLSWYKPDSPPSMGDFELCWTNQDMIPKQISQSIAATNGERVGHPTQKPVRVIQWTLAMIAAGETVLDPYMGSGTTGIACIRTGRQFRGIEIDPAHFETAVRRIEGELAQPMLPMAIESPRETQTHLI